ncbi:hypothetical protein CPB85DRAFT_1566762 [Mucidula mucida]|nr:hypothetical protein CPB85DRAFT_1566762 [Mucidula mucida]
MPHTPFPPELVDLILQHLSGDTYTLRRCALVSRTWAGFSQLILFRDAQLDIRTSKKMAKLLDDLTSTPHLQTLVRAVAVPERCSDDAIPSPVHMSRIASVLSLLPNLTKFVIREYVGADDQVAIQSFLDLIPNVLGNAPLVELDIVIYSFEAFQHLFGILAGTNVKRVTLSGTVRCRQVNLEATRQRLCIPSLEYIRFKVYGDLREEFHHCLVHDFDIPNLKQCEFGMDSPDQLLDWQGTLRQGFPPVGVVKLELGFCIPWSLPFIQDPPDQNEFRPVTHPIALTGVYFHHVHLKANSVSVRETRLFINWWSSTFRALSTDSNTTIHFTELTFTFTVFKDFDALKSACQSLDDSLAHPMFSAVRQIRFKNSNGFISEAVAAKIRLALPQMASRGVLSLV